ncbi:MAG: ABC transporter ATP-binding protein, partial [Clostridium sp.]
MNKLKVENISYSYGKFNAIKDINFEVNDGLVGVLGANGAGKTTLIKLISTLFSIQSGEIHLNELDFKRDVSEIRKNIGYLPQNFSTYENLTGLEFLEIIASIKSGLNKKEIKTHLEDIIKTLGLIDFINRKIKEYSGGMKQKLGFAQVLIGDPKLIIVDEPTVGLDPEQRNIIRELFPIISKNRIVIVTTHIIEDIEYYCNELIIMKKGQVIYNGTKKDFVEKTEGLIWEVTGDETTFTEIANNGRILSTFQEEDKYRLKYMS